MSEKVRVIGNKAFSHCRLTALVFPEALENVGYYMGDSRTLDSHIRSLRHKLNQYGKYIETVRGVGYRWEGTDDK